MANACSANTVSLVVAIRWTGLLGASLSSEADLTVASAIEAVTMIAAVARACIESAIITSPSGIARASEVVL
jgi:hypothetical protein